MVTYWLILGSFLSPYNHFSFMLLHSLCIGCLDLF
uniref:Uncharacterized protein n=1 Tax=Rhizophora mucronata TaxID=61149 RepID=A0A2P2QZN6_RHIMU